MAAGLRLTTHVLWVAATRTSPEGGVRVGAVGVLRATCRVRAPPHQPRAATPHATRQSATQPAGEGTGRVQLEPRNTPGPAVPAHGPAVVASPPAAQAARPVSQRATATSPVAEPRVAAPATRAAPATPPMCTIQLVCETAVPGRGACRSQAPGAGQVPSNVPTVQPALETGQRRRRLVSQASTPVPLRHCS